MEMRRKEGKFRVWERCLKGHGVTGAILEWGFIEERSRRRVRRNDDWLG
jgi:hypothetical protein